MMLLSSYHGKGDYSMLSPSWLQLSHLLPLLRGSQLGEKVKHDKALEAHQAAYAKYEKDQTTLIDWIATNEQIKEEAKQNFTDTDCVFKLYNQAHPDKKNIAPSRAQQTAKVRRAPVCWSWCACLGICCLPFSLTFV